MVNCPDSLVWELTRSNTSFLKKRNGKTKRSGTISFSTEKGNVKSLNQFKYSGLANSKAANIVCTDNNRANLIVKTASKAATQPKKGVATIPMNKDFYRVESAIRKHTQDNFYRRDCEAALLGKWTKVYQANRRAKGIKKTVPCKKGRGNL
mmetsp:Transcript_114802/g.161235  ORF Transcript_114802/g.161235 Transcript_114802/m.161235 type:complete len:151 (+) Transcript_114802:66-518(+)